jgi:GT2 family glycosyltransferase
MRTASIIIINFNTANLTLQAIHSIIQHITAVENFEVIIIDNASDSEDYNDLKLGIAKLNTNNIKLVRSKFNLGFGGGNMLGVQHAVGDYYVFMNSDVILKEDSVSMMIGFINTHKNTSIVGCQAVNENGQKYKGFDYGLSLANELFSNSILQFINKKKYPSRIVTTKEPLVVDSVAGSLFTCLAKDFDAVGGFDTNIFLYYEEKDLAFRIKKHLNKEVYLLPFTEYIHLKGKSSITSQKIKNELKISQFYTIQKNLGTFSYLVFYAINLIVFLFKSPFSLKNRAYFILLLSGISNSKSIKHQQKIQ